MAFFDNSINFGISCPFGYFYNNSVEFNNPSYIFDVDVYFGNDVNFMDII